MNLIKSLALKIVTHNGEIFLTYNSNEEKDAIIKRFPHAHRIEIGSIFGTVFKKTTGEQKEPTPEKKTKKIKS
jgi:hypothetical protein